MTEIIWTIADLFVKIVRLNDMSLDEEGKSVAKIFY